MPTRDCCIYFYKLISRLMLVLDFLPYVMMVDLNLISEASTIVVTNTDEEKLTLISSIVSLIAGGITIVCTFPLLLI